MVPTAQKEAYNGESIYAGVKNYLAESHFRDPASHEYKTWFDLVTVDDFWNWHERLLIPRLLGEEKVQAVGAVQGSVVRLLQHNVLVVPPRMTFIRAKHRPCGLDERLAEFAHNCTHELFLDGLVGEKDTSSWTLTPYMPEEEAAGNSSLRMGVVRDAEGAGAASDLRLPVTLEFEERSVPWPLQEFGYYMSFPRGAAAAHALLADLKSAGAIEAAVKWYRLDFVTFNSNLGVFSYVKFTLELSNTGRLQPRFGLTNIDAAPYQWW